MPIYEYRCESCQTTFEVTQRITEDALTTHDACGGAVRRLISRTAFTLKGQGWYSDHYGLKSDSGDKSDKAVADKSPNGAGPASDKKGGDAASTASSAGSESKPTDAAKTGDKKPASPSSQGTSGSSGASKASGAAGGGSAPSPSKKKA